MSKILKCEGYKMFEGKMLITPKNSSFKPFVEEGTWLYKPEWGYWYGKGTSYSSEVCTPIDDNGKPLE